MSDEIILTVAENNAIEAYRKDIYEAALADPIRQPDTEIDWEEYHFGHVCFGYLVAKGIPVGRADELASIARYRLGIA